MNAAMQKAEIAQKAEFIAKIFSSLPSDQAEQVMELANTYLDGINLGIRLMSRQTEVDQDKQE